MLTPLKELQLVLKLLGNAHGVPKRQSLSILAHIADQEKIIR